MSREGVIMAVETGRVALVTGASSGIGEAAAHELLAAGFTVYGTSRKAVAGEERGGVVFLPLDITEDQSVAGAVREVLGRSGRIDVLVNNAGLGVAGAAEESSIEQAQALFDTNLFGSIRMTRAVLPHMREQRSGRIINVSSVLGVVPAPFGALYAATKHAVEGYSESLDHEVREHGVRVLLVEPAYTRTSFDTNAIPADEPLPVYARRREVLRVLTAEAIKGGDEPSVVGEAVVAAATDSRPKLRYPAGPLARRVSRLRRYAPSAVFDKQIHKINRLNRPAGSVAVSSERTTSNGQSRTRQAGSPRPAAGGEGR
jgi:NAD(P)-dependent dehydrogenase (short-subunit alcohol dehydrogenase family)